MSPRDPLFHNVNASHLLWFVRTLSMDDQSICGRLILVVFQLCKAWYHMVLRFGRVSWSWGFSFQYYYVQNLLRLVNLHYGALWSPWDPELSDESMWWALADSKMQCVWLYLSDTIAYLSGLYGISNLANHVLVKPKLVRNFECILSKPGALPVLQPSFNSHC